MLPLLSGSRRSRLDSTSCFTLWPVSNGLRFYSEGHEEKSMHYWTVIGIQNIVGEWDLGVVNKLWLVKLAQTMSLTFVELSWLTFLNAWCSLHIRQLRELSYMPDLAKPPTSTVTQWWIQRGFHGFHGTPLLKGCLQKYYGQTYYVHFAHTRAMHFSFT